MFEAWNDSGTEVNIVSEPKIAHLENLGVNFSDFHKIDGFIVGYWLHSSIDQQPIISESLNNKMEQFRFKPQKPTTAKSNEFDASLMVKGHGFGCILEHIE